MVLKKPIIVSIHHQLIGKTEAGKFKSASGWTNQELTHLEFKEFLEIGCAHGYQWYGGKRKGENYQGSTVLTVDFDKGLVTLEQALNNKYIKSNAAYIYTTHSHTESINRFHIIFVLPIKVTSREEVEVVNIGLHIRLTTELGYKSAKSIIDPVTKSAASFFFGNPGSLKFYEENIISHEEINRFRALGGRSFVPEHKLLQQDLLHTKHIDPEYFVQLPYSKMVQLSVLSPGEQIHCPSHKPDTHPSAFVIQSQDGVKGVHCTKCNQSWYTSTKSPKSYDFSKIENSIKQYSGSPNTFYKAQGLASIFPEIFVEPASINCNVFSKPFIGILPKYSGIHLIKSAKGTGKTTALKKIVDLAKYNPKELGHNLRMRPGVILIGHRQSLIYEICTKLELTCYLDSHEFDTRLSIEKNKLFSHKPTEYGICLDSLNTRMRLFVESYPIVIIDESEQVFTHLNSDSMKKPIKNFEIISELIGRASHVYCLDADLGEISMDGVLGCLKQHELINGKSTKNSIKSNPKIFFHLNEFRQKTSLLHLHPSKYQMASYLYDSLNKGEKCYVTSNSKGEIEALHQFFSKKFPNKKLLLVTSENSTEQDIRALIADIKNTVIEYDAIFSSPSLGTGIDITFDKDEKIVDCVYGFFGSKINTHFDVDQQLSRVRHPKEIRVWIDESASDSITDFTIVKQELLDKLDIPSQASKITNLGVDFTLSQSPFFDLLAKILVIRRESQRNFKSNFIGYKESQGWKIINEQYDQNREEFGKSLLGIGKELVAIGYEIKILEAPLITAKEYQELEKRNIREDGSQITQAEKIAIQKFWIDKIYKREITSELLRLDNRGRFREALNIYAGLCLSPLNVLKLRSEFDRLQLAVLVMSDPVLNINNVEKVTFLAQCFDAAGIYKNNAFLKEAIWSQKSLAEFVAFCEDPYNQATCNRLFGLSIRVNDLKTRAAYQLGVFLRLAGLLSKVHTKNSGRPGSTYSYRLDLDRLNLVEEIIGRWGKEGGSEND